MSGVENANKEYRTDAGSPAGQGPESSGPESSGITTQTVSKPCFQAAAGQASQDTERTSGARADCGLLPICVTSPPPSLLLVKDSPLVFPTHCLHTREVSGMGWMLSCVCRKETFVS